jgi:hypothetical protein
MRLYKTTGQKADLVQETRWDGSLAAASKRRVELKKAGRKQVTTDEVEIPTDKVGLLEWLNANCC